MSWSQILEWYNLALVSWRLTLEMRRLTLESWRLSLKVIEATKESERFPLELQKLPYMIVDLLIQNVMSPGNEQVKVVNK